MLNIGDTAPDFLLPDQAGKIQSLHQLLLNGQMILYFYPADFSPVCTAQACTFRENLQVMEPAGIQIVGISPQSSGSHRRFSEHYGLPFPLLSDVNKQVIRAYGVDGLLGFGVRRATFLIDQSGIIINRVVADYFVGAHADLLKATVQAVN